MNIHIYDTIIFINILRLLLFFFFTKQKSRMIYQCDSLIQMKKCDSLKESPINLYIRRKCKKIDDEQIIHNIRLNSPLF